MSTVENEVASRGWDSVLEELAGLAARERNAALALGTGGACDRLLESLNAATRAGREVEAQKTERAGER
jgi:hypothetical protein